MTMLRHTVIIATAACGVAVGGFTARASGQSVVTAGAVRVTLDAHATVTALSDATTGRDLLARGEPAPLLTVVNAGRRLAPSSLRDSRSGSRRTLTLRYQEIGVEIAVRVREVQGYVAFEIVSATPASGVDAVIWGPYPTTIKETVGEIIGVVRNGQTALGLQVLNLKTLGGDLPNSEGSTWARGITALGRPYGSVLQAYTINRDRERRVDAWGGVYKNMLVTRIPGETVVGSAIALFGCPEPETLTRLEQIEVAEHLPHPTVDGAWIKRSPIYNRSYLISSFGESDVDEMIGYTKRAGLYSLYHEGPFKSWGHFLLDERQFPNGRAGLKRAVDKARAAGIHFGTHTLTNFINTNDPYVTPVPDDRLSVTGASTLVHDVDATQTTLEVASPEYFNQDKDNNLHAVKIGKEIVQYRAVTASAPYALLDVQRGAFGTAAAAHRAGEAAGKLFDHPYKVFFPNFAMQREVATNLAQFLNETGVDHIDFDGHEGALASGQGDYALAVFAKDVLEQTNHDLINGTSISKTFYWHIGSYYNWGEPWYGGFNESMQQYRIDNQGLFDRNFMPHMLGWYLLTENTTLPEMEWMLARAAGYRAGFAMVARPKALRGNPITGILLDAIREWEDARTRHAFDAQQESRLQDPKRDFHLEKIGHDAWALHEYATSPVFVRERMERQPGEPTSSTWELDQAWKEQRLQFRLAVTGKSGAVRALRLQIDHYASVVLPLELTAGESVICDGSTTIQLYDAKGKRKGSFTLPTLPPVLAPGHHSMQLDSDFSGDDPPRIDVQFKGMSRTEQVRAHP